MFCFILILCNVPGILCGIGDSKHCVYTFSATVSPNPQKMLRRARNMSKEDIQTLKIHRGFIAHWY